MYIGTNKKQLRSSSDPHSDTLFFLIGSDIPSESIYGIGTEINIYIYTCIYIYIYLPF